MITLERIEAVMRRAIEPSIVQSAERMARELREQGASPESVDEQIDAYIALACESLEANIRQNAKTVLDEIRRQLVD